IVRREIRLMTNGPSSILNYNRPGHVWLRLVRSGSNFTGYTSVDGSTWSFAFSATISMNGCVYAGVFAESTNVNVTTNASFDNVSIGGGVAPLAGSPDVNPAETHPLIVEENHEFSLRVYPNPTTGEVNLGLEDYQGRAVRIEVYSMLGQLLNFVEIDEVQTTVTKLDLSAYQNGAYLIRIATDGAPSVVKWVDKK
ncbi:MAG: T9SS type A sorting domain-containing protein, partial [Saprospiraceae bacterium]|nr:T9SS type A sorting domain-containing protein [Saprospiraceae bacterium]